MAGGLLLVGAVAYAGQAQPIGGVTGTIALEGNVEKFYAGVNTILVKTIDGVEHLIHLTERTVVHGGRAAGGDPLAGIEEGSRVVVHYKVERDNKTAYEIDRIGENGLKTIEGVVVRVDRQAKTMSIRLADGRLQTLGLTERAASDVGKDIDRAAGTAKVVVYFTDEEGRRVAHYFKRVS
jgi:hypothetical protein